MKKAFVIGHPISHSKSPILHGHWLIQHQIAGQYEALDVDPSDLETFALKLKQGAFVGGNVTVPHKEAIMNLCDEISPTAKNIGAVNTLWMQNGNLHGDNTDKYGFLANLDQHLPNWDQNNTTALVLGSGGAARAILAGLVERNYHKIFVLNRTIARAEALCDEFNTVFDKNRLSAGTLNDFNRLVENANLVVNTSAVGMNGTKFDDLHFSNAPNTTIVTDIVYTPLETPFLADAKRAGLRTVDGIGMLLHQAVPGFERWFDVRPHVTDTLRQKILGENHA